MVVTILVPAGQSRISGKYANARAAFIGMSMAHGRADLARSVMEGVTLGMRDIMEIWQENEMKVSVLGKGGGATRSVLWNQIQADLYERPVQPLKNEESSVLGAAILGGVGAGVFHSIREGVESMVRVSGNVEPDMEHHKIYEEMYEAYVLAYEGLSQKVFDRLAAIQKRPQP